MKFFSYAELDRLGGELLPERAVLSALMSTGGDSYNNNNAGSGGLLLGQMADHGTTTVVNGCQSTVSHPGAGLLAAIGANTQNDSATYVCSPGTIVSSR